MAKINKCDYIKLNFCTRKKEPINKMKSNLTNERKHFQIVSRIYEEFIHLKAKKQFDLKMGRGPFHKKMMQQDGQHEKVLNIITIRKRHIKTTMRYQLKPVKVSYY